MKIHFICLLVMIYCIMSAGCSETTDNVDIAETTATTDIVTTEAETTEPAPETFFELEPKSPDEPEYYGDPVLEANENCDIPLEFQPYNDEYLSEIEYEISSDYESESKVPETEILLGRKAKCFRGTVEADGEAYEAVLCFDATDGELFFVYPATVYNLPDGVSVITDVFDIDGDGSQEVLTYIRIDEYVIERAIGTDYLKTAIMVDNDGGTIVCTDIYEALYSYASRECEANGISMDNLYVQNILYVGGLRFNYFVVTRPEAGYTYVQNKIEYAGVGFNVTDSFSHNFDMFAPYTSNSDDWSVEVSYKELYPEGYNERRSYYGIGIFGTNGKKYYYYMEDNINRSPIIFGRSDERSTNALVVNEELGYALLLYPRFTDTADTVLYDNIAVIDLANGDIVYQYYDSVSVAKELVGVELAEELVRGVNAFGMNPNYVKTTAEPSDGGFELTIEVFLDGYDETFVTHGRLTYNPDSEQLFDIEF